MVGVQHSIVKHSGVQYMRIALGVVGHSKWGHSNVLQKGQSRYAPDPYDTKKDSFIEQIL